MRHRPHDYHLKRRRERETLNLLMPLAWLVGLVGVGGLVAMGVQAAVHGSCPPLMLSGFVLLTLLVAAFQALYILRGHRKKR